MLFRKRKRRQVLRSLSLSRPAATQPGQASGLSAESLTITSLRKEFVEQADLTLTEICFPLMQEHWL